MVTIESQSEIPVYGIAELTGVCLLPAPVVLGVNFGSSFSSVAVINKVRSSPDDCSGHAR